MVTDQNSGMRGELPVTVKVINSGEDNEPGRVRIQNRQPEVGVELVAELTDPDNPGNNVKWQWYRKATPTTNQGEACTERDPFAEEASPPPFRYFLDPVNLADDSAWQMIPGANGNGKIAKYTPDYKAAGASVEHAEPTLDMPTETWTGGDIGVTLTTDETGSPPYPKPEYSNWVEPKCLRVAFTYEDAVDRTFQQTDPDANDGVNQVHEGAFVGSEMSVKRHDLKNKKPLFHEIADVPAGGPDTDKFAVTYTVEKPENADAASGLPTTAGSQSLAFHTMLEVLHAVDVANPTGTTNDEDDSDDAATNPAGAGLGNDDADRLTLLPERR